MVLVDEAVDLARDPYRIFVGIESGEGSDAALTAQYCGPPGAGTRQNDLYETEALKRSFGPHAYRIPVSSIASMIGHALGAAGSLGLTAGALTIEHGVVPPTANLHDPDPACDLDYTPLTARRQRTDAVLTVGSGFGGFQSAMILTSPSLKAAAA